MVGFVLIATPPKKRKWQVKDEFRAKAQTLVRPKRSKIEV